MVLAQYVEDMAGPGSGVDRYRDSGPDKLEIHNKLLLERWIGWINGSDAAVDEFNLAYWLRVGGIDNETTLKVDLRTRAVWGRADGVFRLK